VIAQAAPEATPLLTLAVCATGLVPLAWLVRRRWQGRPVLRTNPAAFVRSSPMTLGLLALLYFLLYGLAGLAVVTTHPVAGIGGALATVLAGLVLYLVVARRVFRPQGTQRERIGRGLLVLWAAMPLIYGVALLLQWIGFDEPQESIEWLARRRHGWQLVALHAVLIAPVAEEFCFRGLLYPALRQLRGPAYAVLLTALAFGLIHIQLAVVVPMILFGVVMAWLCETNGSFLPCVLGHIAFNALTVLQLLLI
jgi:membrane protease YdiL (CAAX protease family)